MRSSGASGAGNLHCLRRDDIGVIEKGDSLAADVKHLQGCGLGPVSNPDKLSLY